MGVSLLKLYFLYRQSPNHFIQAFTHSFFFPLFQEEVPLTEVLFTYLKSKCVQISSFEWIYGTA